MTKVTSKRGRVDWGDTLESLAFAVGGAVLQVASVSLASGSLKLDYEAMGAAAFLAGGTWFLNKLKSGQKEIKSLE